MSKNEVLIIVHGAWPIKFHLRLLEKIRRILLAPLTAARSILRTDYHKFMEYIEEEYDKIEILRWSGGLTSSDINPAIEHLSKLLKKYKNNKIDIISFSLGGFITQKALKLRKEVNIRKIIFAGSIHDPLMKISNTGKIINLYSTKDRFLELAEYFYTGTKNRILNWKNVRNIQVRDLTHDNLCQNKSIQIDGKNKMLFEYYKELLTQ